MHKNAHVHIFVIKYKTSLLLSYFLSLRFILIPRCYPTKHAEIRLGHTYVGCISPTTSIHLAGTSVNLFNWPYGHFQFQT